jgi:hypothetical protein
MLLSLVGVLEDGGVRSPHVPINPRTTLNMTLGADVTLSVRVVRPNGQPVVGGTLTWTVKKKATDMQASFTKAGDCKDPTTFTVTPADTKRLTPGLFIYDVWHTAADHTRNAVVPFSSLFIEPAATTPP